MLCGPRSQFQVRFETISWSIGSRVHISINNVLDFFFSFICNLQRNKMFVILTFHYIIYLQQINIYINAYDRLILSIEMMTMNILNILYIV